MDIIGHSEQLTFFEKAKIAERLHHAYLFVGKSGLGKRTVAEHLAKNMFDAPDVRLDTNPDFFFLSRGVHEKTGKTKKNISINDVQGLQHFLQGKPFLHTKKIAIIHDAHLLSIGAMNALLKTLEEPRGNAMIFLIAEDEQALLETIRSRCQVLYFHPVAEEDIQQALIAKQIDADIAHGMAELSMGSPGRAFIWADDPDEYDWYTKEVARCQSLFGKPFFAQRALIEDLFTKRDDHIVARTKLLTILDIWLMTVRKRYTQSSSNPAQKCAIVEAYNAIHHAKKGLLQNVHPRLLIEHVLLTFA